MLGKVKTRLAKGLGEERALRIYRQLLSHTHAVTCGLSCDKFIFYAEEIGTNDLWEDAKYHKALQQGNDLGEKMQHAFLTVFNKGYSQVIIIGSDCMELTHEVIRNAFAALCHEDVFVGPSADGGYYLLGLTAMHNRLFEQMPWSTEAVLNETLNRCREAGLRFAEGPVLHDIDGEADWHKHLAAQAARTGLVFVYNADNDLFSTVTDWVHKILSPATYACSLCALTHHHAGMKGEWKRYIDALPYRSRFLHKDEFIQSYPAYKEILLPAVFTRQNDALHLLLSAAVLNSLHTLEELKGALENQLKQHDLDHHTSV